MLTPSIRVLSLDGGGARCLSGLVILEELIQHIEEDHHDSPLGDSRPYYYFDLICGTEWGAVIALMLGRLRMTINECILWFQRNAFHYTPWFWESRDFSNSDRCEKALDALFAEEPLYEAQPKQGHVCHIVVLVTDLENLGTPERLRSYTSKTYGKAIVSRCTILQAALASIATPMRTRGVRIDAMLCVSAAIAGFSNPALEALDEAASIWSSTKIYSFVSIGTGIQEPRDSASAGGRPRWLGYPSPKATMGLMRVITHMIIDPEHTAIELFRFSRAAGFLCSRFTLPTEFTSTTYKHEWTPVAFERVPKLTRLYLANSEITASLIVCANSLKPSKSLGTDGERGNPVFSSVDPPAVPSETMLDTLGPEFLVKCPSLKAVSTQSALSGTTEPFEGILFDEPTVRSDQKENLATDNYMKGLRARYQQLFKDAPEDIRKVKVAVLDSGIDSSHPFIEANWIRPRWGARGENGLPRKLDDDGYMDFTTESPLTKNGTDTCGHGTHVAGIILQLAPDAELHVGRVFRDKTFSKKTDPECTMRIAKAIRYAVDVWGVDVISMSFGFSSIPADVKEAIIYAYSKDRILVAAASNNGNSKSSVSMLRTMLAHHTSSTRLQHLVKTTSQSLAKQ
ncbi:FabD/lysophospholipase-like protein [Lophium mytilinum]|uniref:FabD/lysophospholipase-like protein n=1 Tax=Lophium mytilinum TaxID=390894 RepID=A0A6A6QHF8_9PEZI|nr:FabD/lysophospholipase-like protein [Lophium mytilinum]